MYTSLAATSETLRQLLADSMNADVGPGGLAAFFANANTEVSLSTPREMGGHTQGLSVWLYRVVRDEHRLNDPPTLRPRPSGGVEVVPPPLPLRLHYLITPLANNSPEMEQRILGRVLQTLHSQPSLAGSVLRGDLAGTDHELNVRLEALDLEEITRVWEALEGSYQLSVSYEVTLARIESAAEPERASLVESVRPEAAVIVGRSA